MLDLRLIGVHEDGVHLLLADDEGNRYRVPLDESLRAAARRDRPRLGQLQIEIEGGLRPKDVQAMIRAGLTAEEAAERAGWTVEKVHRYEVPILAEREHVAGLARQVRLRGRGAHGGASTLGARVAERLRSRELDPEATRWDSRRTDRGVWTVVVLFNAGGRQREAAWDFDPLARTVIARDDEARWLSEDEDTQTPGPIPAPHLATPAGPAHVYDVEAEGGISTRSRHASTSPAEPVDLVEAMRERGAQRGRRRRGRGADVPGIDDAPEDALPLEDLARPPSPDESPPAAHGHPEDDPRAARTSRATVSGKGPTGGSAPAAPGARPRRRATARGTASAERAPTSRGGDAAETQPLPQTGGTGRGARRPHDDEGGRDSAVRGRRTGRPTPDRRLDRDTIEDTIEDPHDASLGDPDHDDPPADEVTSARARPHAAATSPRPSTRKSGRPSVPSWDDIMFGRKGD
jgi:hypothetical protein